MEDRPTHNDPPLMVMNHHAVGPVRVLATPGKTVRKVLTLIPSIRHRHRLKRNLIPQMSKKWMLPAFSKVRHYRYWIPLELMNQEFFPVKRNF